MNLALFDFDGTITTKDSLTLFFKYISSTSKYFYGKYIYTLPYLIAYKLKLINSEDLKLKRINFFLKGINKVELKKKSQEFYNSKIETILKKSAIERINWHQINGDKVIIVSASIDIILNIFCNKFKLELITNVITFEDEICTGKLEGKDCNAEEKVRRILNKINLSEFDEIYAYGDTDGDLPMLSIASNKFYKFFN